MSQKASVLDYALQIARAGVAGALAFAIGTAPDAAAAIGFYADTTGAAEKMAMVVGGQTGPIYTRSGADVNAAFSGAVSLTKQLTSTLATGTAPFVVASTTVVANLNVSSLLGATWAAPAAIGSGTPAAGTFSTITNSALTATRIPYASTAGLLVDDSAFTRIAGGASALIVDSALDATLTAGNACMGFAASGSAGQAYWYQRGIASPQTNYALSQAGSSTVLNASITNILRIANVSKVTLTATSATFAAGVPVTISDTTSGTTTVGSLVVGNGTAATTCTMGAGIINCGSGIQIGASAPSAIAGSLSLTGTNSLTITQGAVTGAVRTSLAVNPVAATLVTSGTENPQVKFNFARTQQWATTTPATQREFLIDQPTYSCDTVSQTITTAATVAIIGAPVAGTNVTITTPLALWVQAGNVNIAAATASTTAATGCLTLGGGLGVAGAMTITGAVTAAGNVQGNRLQSAASVTTAAATGICAMWRSGGTIGSAGYSVYQSDLAGNNSHLFRAGTTTPVTVGEITGLGSIVPWNAALATNATDGFVYMASCAGTPTGVPTTFTGRVAFCYDSTNNIIYLYNGAWKKTVALT